MPATPPDPNSAEALIERAIHELEKPVTKLMVLSGQLPHFPYAHKSADGTFGVHIGLVNVTLKVDSVLRYAVQLILAARAAADHNIQLVNARMPMPEDQGPPVEPCCDKHRVPEHHNRVFNEEMLQKSILKPGQSPPKGWVELMPGVWVDPANIRDNAATATVVSAAPATCEDAPAGALGMHSQGRDGRCVWCGVQLEE